MLCDRCKQNQASVRVSRIFNGVKDEQSLCGECAGAECLELASIMDMSIFGLKPQVNAVAMPMRKIFIDRQQIKSGETDYEALGLKLPDLESYESKAENGENDLAILKKQLEASVKDQDFEKAAELRDKIHFLEKQSKGSNETDE